MSELRQVLDTLLHRHAEIDEIKEIIKDDYKAAQSAGFDKAALGAAVLEIRARAKAESPKGQERAALVEMYVAEYDRASHVHAREEAA
jgi:uncharacterized protein (UPF0335 family)